MRLDDVEPRAQGCIALRLYPEGPDDEKALQALAMLSRGIKAKVEFDTLLNKVCVIISC